MHIGTGAAYVALPPKADRASFGLGFRIGRRLRIEELVGDVGSRQARAEDPRLGALKGTRNPFTDGQAFVVLEH